MKRPQFSLRTLFLMLTTTAVFMGWIGHSLDEYRAEQQVIAQLSDALIAYDSVVDC